MLHAESHDGSALAHNARPSPRRAFSGRSRTGLHTARGRPRREGGMKRSALNHPKLRALMAEAGISRLEALGLLTLLWDFTGQYAPNGAIGRFTNSAIAEACDWPAERADELVRHLVRTKWLDEVADHSVRLVVHDWADHCEDWVRKRLKRDGKSFYSGNLRESTHRAGTETGEVSGRNGGTECPDEAAGQNGGPKRAPSPSHALPTPSHALPTPSQAKPDSPPKGGRAPTDQAGEPERTRTREPNPWWDTTAEVFSLDPAPKIRSHRTRLGQLARDFKALCPDDPGEIARRAARWHRHFPGATCTPDAVLKHWGALGKEPDRVKPGFDKWGFPTDD